MGGYADNLRRYKELVNQDQIKPSIFEFSKGMTEHPGLTTLMKEKRIEGFTMKIEDKDKFLLVHNNVRVIRLAYKWYSYQDLYNCDIGYDCFVIWKFMNNDLKYLEEIFAMRYGSRAENYEELLLADYFEF